MYASKSPPSILKPFRSRALAFSCSSTSANCLLKACIVLSHSHSSCSWTWKLVTWRRNHALIAFTHSLTNGPCRYMRNSIARWNGILIWLLVILTPSYSCHWVENSSDLVLSPLKTVGGFPISLSLPLGASSGARLVPGDPALPPPPPGGPPPKPPGGPPLGSPPPYGRLENLSLAGCDGGSALSGPTARFTATSSSVSMCPVMGSMVPTWACVVSV